MAGSTLLAVVAAGSGIAAQELSPGDTGLKLLEEAMATGAGLYVLISRVGLSRPPRQYPGVW
jgi:hypothetical protein